MIELRNINFRYAGGTDAGGLEKVNLNYSRYLFQQCSMPYKHCVLTILLFHLISETISIQKRASSLL